jgi:ureidoglycolate lyase
MKLTIEDLTTGAFAPFGAVVERPQRAQDAAGPGWIWWGENLKLAGGDRPYALGYLDLKPAPLRFDWAERHLRSDELLIPMGGDCLVYVGPADHLDEPMRLPPLERFRVFRVRSGQAVLLNKGVWHGAPLALDRPLNVVVVLLHDTGRQDGHVVRFEATPVDIERSEGD